MGWQEEAKSKGSKHAKGAKSSEMLSKSKIVPKEQIASVIDRPPPPPQNSLRQPPVRDTRTFEKSSITRMKMKPSFAAAMLSLPWPLPENPKLAIARLREEQARKKVVADIADIKNQLEREANNDNGNAIDDQKSTQACCCGTSSGTGSCCRKLYMKKKSQCSMCPFQTRSKQKQAVVFDGRSQRKPGEAYLPVTTPPFNHVHTAWPGFDHSPVPNWKKKYMIAKPFPQSHSEKLRCNQSSQMWNTSEKLTISRQSEHVDLVNRNFTGRSLASSRSPSMASTDFSVHLNKMEGIFDGRSDASIAGTETVVPKQRLHLERVGSCQR